MAAEPLYNYKIKCPFCETTFETTRMRPSTIRVKEQQTDFGSIFEGECPYFYAITVCPNCSFAARNSDFEKIRINAEAKIMAASKQLRASTKPKPNIFQLGPSTPEVAAKRFELAIAFYKMRYVVEMGVLANMYLHLVWIQRLSGNQEKEQTALLNAATVYEEYLAKAYTLPDTLGEPGVIYLIGELYRRQGKLKEARRLFESGLASKELREYPKIGEMIRDRIAEIKAEMEKTGQTAS